jgi:thiol-disulfide isomerase/thioredoxin
MKRRDWVLAAGAAAAAGFGWQQWRRPEGAPAEVPAEAPAKVPAALAAAPASAPASSAGEDGADSIWQATFTQPDGQPLVMTTLRGTPLVINFWGTWCPPCVKEMPELDRFARQFAPRGGRVLGLAVDNAKAVREFLTRQPVGYTIAMAGFEGTDLSRKLGNTSGALPFTAVFDRRGQLVQRRLGETHFDELLRWTQNL